MMEVDNGAMLNNLALFYGARGEIHKAELLFRRAIVADSANSVVRENLAEILRAERRWPEVIHLLPRAFSARSPRAALLVADALCQTEAVEEAARRLEEYRETDPNEPRVIAVLGYLLSAFLEKGEEGIQLLRKATLEHPEEASVAANLVYALITAGRLEEARAMITPWLEQARSLNAPALICIAASWGLLLIREGDYESGIDAYQQVWLRAKEPLKTRIQQKILIEQGRRLLAIGQTADGEATLLKAIAIKADPEFGREARHLLGSARRPN
jgi:Flp pilus assembly protein TadD